MKKSSISKNTKKIYLPKNTGLCNQKSDVNVECHIFFFIQVMLIYPAIFVYSFYNNIHS